MSIFDFFFFMCIYMYFAGWMVEVGNVKIKDKSSVSHAYALQTKRPNSTVISPQNTEAYTTRRIHFKVSMSLN